MFDHEISALRGSLGIKSTGFELTQDDYFELYQFDLPDNWEAFQQSCDQVRAKFPTMIEFQKLQGRYQKEINNPPKFSPEAAEVAAKRTDDYYADKPGFRRRLSNARR